MTCSLHHEPSCPYCCDHDLPFEVDCAKCKRLCVPHDIQHDPGVECAEGWKLAEDVALKIEAEKDEALLLHEAIDTKAHQVGGTYGDVERGAVLFDHLTHLTTEMLLTGEKPYLELGPQEDPVLASAYLGMHGLTLAHKLGVEQQKVNEELWWRTTPLALMSAIASTIVHRSNWFSHWYSGEQRGRTPQELLRHPFCWDSEHGEPFSFYTHYVVVGQSGEGKTTPLTQTRILFGETIKTLSVTRTYIPGYFGYLIPRKGGSWETVDGYVTEAQDGVVQFREGSLFPALIKSDPMALPTLMTFCENGYYESRTKASGWLQYYVATVNQVCIQSEKFPEVFGGDAAGLIRRFVVSIIPWKDEWKYQPKGELYPPDPLALKCWRAFLAWLRAEFHPKSMGIGKVVKWIHDQSVAHPELHISETHVQRWVSLATAYYALGHPFPVPEHVELPEPDETLARVLLQEASDRMIAYQTLDDARMNRAAPVLLFAPPSLVGTEEKPIPFGRQELFEHIAKTLEMNEVESVKNLFYGRRQEEVPSIGLLTQEEKFARLHKEIAEDGTEKEWWDPPDESSVIQRYRGPMRPFDPEGPSKRGRSVDLYILNWKALRTYLGAFPSGREALQKRSLRELSKGLGTVGTSSTA